MHIRIYIHMYNLYIHRHRGPIRDSRECGYGYTRNGHKYSRGICLYVYLYIYTCIDTPEMVINTVEVGIYITIYVRISHICMSRNKKFGKLS
jgi:hypothetical protein